MKKSKVVLVCIGTCLVALVAIIGQTLFVAHRTPHLSAQAATYEILGPLPTDMHTLEELISTEELNHYTDSDFFECDCNEIPENKSIQTYIEDNHDIYANNYGDVLKDNDIVRIIPRILFEKAGDYYYSGKEYGFFIQTRYRYSTSMTSIYPESHVLVFDIAHTTGESQREIKYRVTYLFSRVYATLTSAEAGMSFQNQASTAVLHYSEDGVNPFYMENIKVGMGLKNTFQPTDNSESSYDLYADTGAILEQTRLNYVASKVNPNNHYDVRPLGKAVGSYILGTTAKFIGKKIPVIGVGLKVYDVLKKIVSFTGAGLEGIPPRTFDISAGNEANIYTRLSRTEQLEHIISGMEHDALFSERNFTRDCVMDLDEVSLCAPSEYFEIVYVLSDTAEPAQMEQSFSFDLFNLQGKIKNTTINKNSLNLNELKISYEDLKDELPFIAQNTLRLFDRPMTFEVKPDEEFAGYLIGDSEEYLTVTPSFSSRYLLDCSDPELVLSVTDAAGNAVTLSDGNAALKKGQTYRIKVRSEVSRASGSFRFTLKYNPEKYQNAVLNANAAAGDSTLFALDAAAGIVNIGITASSRIFARLLDEHMNLAAPLITGEDIVLSATVDNGRYYIEIINDSANAVAVRLAPEVSHAQPNIELSNLAISGRRWLEFAPYQTGVYKLKFTSDSKLRLAICQPNSEQEIYSTTNSELTFTATAGVKYRIRADAVDVDTAYANAVVTFAPESVDYGDSTKTMRDADSYYSFVVGTAAVYTFDTNDPNVRIELLDKTTKPIYVTSSSGSRVTAALMVGEIFIKVSAAAPRAFTLSIGIEARDVPNSQQIDAKIHYNGYLVYRLTTDQFSGDYQFHITGVNTGITLYDANFRLIKAYNSDFRYPLASASVYYLKIEGATDADSSFEYWFDPAEIFVRRSVRTGDGNTGTKSSYYVFNVPATMTYRFKHVGAGEYFGQTAQNLQLNYTVMDGQFRLLASNLEKIELQTGRYYLYVSGAVDSLFSINYADPQAAGADAYLRVSEGILDDFDFVARETKNLLFTPSISGNYEVRLVSGEQDRYLYSFFVKNGDAFTRLSVTEKSDSTGLIQVNRYFTMSLTAGKTYLFVIDSAMDSAANNFYFAVVRPGAVGNSYYHDARSNYHSLSSGSTTVTTTGTLAFGNTYRFYANPTACSAAVATPDWFIKIGGQVGHSYPDGVLKIPVHTTTGTAVTVTLRIDRDVRTFNFTVAEPYQFSARIDTSTGCRYVVDVKDEYGVTCSAPSTMKLSALLTEDGSTAYANGTLNAAVGSNAIDLLGLPIFHTIHLGGALTYKVETRNVSKSLANIDYVYDGKTWTTLSTGLSWMKLDVSNTGLTAAVNKSITIPASVKAINILGRTAQFAGVRLYIASRTDKLIVNIVNLNVTGYNEFLYGSGTVDIDLRAYGTNYMTGILANAINVRDLTITGTGSLDVKTDYRTAPAIAVRNLTSSVQTLNVTGGQGADSYGGGLGIKATGEIILQGAGTVTVRGGKGKNGANGVAGAKGADGISSSKNGANGTAGSSGGASTAGGMGIEALQVTVKGSVGVSIYGGDGGIGGIGGAGGNGGKGFNPSGYNVAGGIGGAGGNGGAGGSGSQGGAALKATKLDVTSASKIVNLYGGKGGSAGSGGKGGNGAAGGNGTHGATGAFQWGPIRNGGFGGDGGKGGNGGSRGNFAAGQANIITTTVNPNNKLMTTAGATGAVGAHGTGGTGGNGGNGGNWSGAGGGGVAGTGGTGGLSGDGVTRAANGVKGVNGHAT